MELIVGFLVMVLIMRLFIGIGRFFFDLFFWLAVGFVLVMLIGLV